MPPQKTEHRAKKANSITKPKGAVRAKSGCYTCRIRRKKCDEKRVGDGPCETCFRLKLECLGFGAKRPDWLRETTRVSAIRNKIKDHLAAQGMIKGHSGSGSRSTVQEDYLRLSEYRDSDIAYPSGSSTSESPHRELSEESDRAFPLSFTPGVPLTGQYQMHVHSPDFLYPHDDLRSSRCVSPSNSMMMMQNSHFPELDEPMSSDTFTIECEDDNLYTFM